MQLCDCMYNRIFNKFLCAMFSAVFPHMRILLKYLSNLSMALVCYFPYIGIDLQMISICLDDPLLGEMRKFLIYAPILPRVFAEIAMLLCEKG